MSAIAPESSDLPAAEISVGHEGARYVVRVVGDHLRIARETPAGPEWLDLTVAVDELGGEARRALHSGDLTCPALRIGLRFLVAAALTTSPTRTQRHRGLN